MNNFGFINKKKIAREIAKIYNTKGHDVFDSGACSALNLLCENLDVKPMHLNKSDGGTREMCKPQIDKES